MQIATAIYFMTLNTNSWFGVVPGFFLLFTGTVGLLAATHRNANYALTVRYPLRHLHLTLAVFRPAFGIYIGQCLIFHHLVCHHRSRRCSVVRRRWTR